MRAFSFSSAPLEPERYRAELGDPACGGYASFEGWVRDHNEGHRVSRLEYEAFEALALKEGERIVAAAIEKFGVRRAACVHRVGDLAIGELAVWVGVSAAHRDEAFAACRYIIDEVKHRVPIWKKEHYEDGDSGWVNCERCAHGAHDEHDASSGPGGFRHDYSRQTVLPEVGEEGQRRLRAASVLVIGAGGLGVPVLQYLAAAGVGRIAIMDHDRVEASNLHRQPLYGIDDIGQPKALVAAERLARITTEVHFEAIVARAEPGNLAELIGHYDLTVECTDNLRTKFVVNDAAVRAGRPAIFASVYQYEGQLQAYLPEPDWPCVRCLWPDAPRDGLVGNCAEAGVLGPVPATLGSMQAMLALRILLDLEPRPVRGLVVMDLLTFETRSIAAARNPDCDHGSAGAAATHAGTGGLAEAGDLEVAFADLAAARAAGFEVVDVREEWELRMDRPGRDTGLHLPLSELLDGRRSFPAVGRHLIVCAHGVRSLALAEHLREQGRPEVYSLRGGIAAIDD
ncbi:MAG TPA: ThiF family adenylyltransferase [Steroidobacteraceae bacterium]|nr:ThiF family adenylyltransferase [Steroidobacteraceae bacterium]